MNVPLRRDPPLLTGNAVGDAAGYASADAAIEALRAATAGDHAAAGVVELDGRFRGFNIEQRNSWLTRLLMVRDVNGKWPDTRAQQIPYSDPLHLTDANRDLVRLTDPRLIAIVDGETVIRR